MSTTATTGSVSDLMAIRAPLGSKNDTPPGDGTDVISLRISPLGEVHDLDDAIRGPGGGEGARAVRAEAQDPGRPAHCPSRSPPMVRTDLSPVVESQIHAAPPLGTSVPAAVASSVPAG